MDNLWTYVTKWWYAGLVGQQLFLNWEVDDSIPCHITYVLKTLISMLWTFVHFSTSNHCERAGAGRVQGSTYTDAKQFWWNYRHISAVAVHLELWDLMLCVAHYNYYG